MKFGRTSLSVMAFMAAAIFSSCNSTGAGTQPAGGQSEVDKSLIGAGGAEGATDFFVTSVTPNEEVPSSVSFPSVQIQFSKPVVPLQKLGEPITKSDVVTISPKLNGVFRWYGTSLLSFDCSDALIPQKEYAITVNPDLKSADGTAISGPVCYTFHTEELKLKSVVPGYIEQKEKKMAVNPNDIPPEYAQNIALTFSNKVNVN
ncbi:MAG: Ig-like domain-containing protein, partial [Treponema sp.]|nr:Ig-like domain-containing protein [Treponema sp.]